MSPEKENLREDISLLDEWVDQRAKQLEQSLNEENQRVRDVVRLGGSELEIERHRERIKSLNKEIDSLNELRQIRELKRALLDKI